MARQLRTVESLPEHRVQQLLPGLLGDEADAADDLAGGAPDTAPRGIA